jgi:acyl-CoA synthetase (AMP-forming)/AMP-acid ligase II
VSHGFLDLSAGKPESPALYYGSGVVTYAELRRRVAAVSGFLLASAGEPGDRIGLWSENSPFFVSVYLGVIQAGRAVVPFQVDGNEESFGRMVEEAGLRAVFVSRRYAARVTNWARGLGVRAVAETQVDGLSGQEGATFPVIDPARDLVALMFTSGSTGVPKGVMVTRRNLASNTADIIEYMGLTARERVMVVLPFHYCFGLSLLHTHLEVGGSLVLNNQFMYPEKVLEDMLARECTGLAGVPSTYQILLRKSRFKQLEFPALRWFQQAGGKLPDPFIREILETFPRVKYYLMYGQTEATARLSYLPPERLADKLGSIGKGLPSTRLEVLRPDGRPVTPGSEEVGEIVASGDNITLGYWNDPEETAKFFRGGKLYTGDLARVDADGFIYIVERDREMIKCGGNRVSAKEVEDVIAEMPGVVEVAVIGVPHELLGEAVRAFVVPVPDAEIAAEAVRDHCLRRLPAFKAPESVQLMASLPHNNSGKVMKARLKKLAQPGLVVAAAGDALNG